MFKIRILSERVQQYKLLEPSEPSDTVRKAFEKNSYLLKKFYRDFIKFALLPSLQSLKSNEQVNSNLKKAVELAKVKESDDYPFQAAVRTALTAGLHSALVATLKTHLSVSIIKNIIMDAILYGVDGSLENTAEDLSNVADLYEALYMNTNAEPAELPILRRTGKETEELYGDENDNLFRSWRVVKDRFPELTRAEELKPISILKVAPVKAYLANGSFGTVYSLTDDTKVLKLFRDSYDLKKEMARYNKVMDEIFPGESKTEGGSLDDLHYFDVGTLKTKSQKTVNFAVMARIVPLKGSAKYVKNRDSYLSIAAQVMRMAKNQMIPKTYKEFEDMFFRSLTYQPEVFEPAVKKLGEDEVSKLLKAGFRAYWKFGGTDLHGGNVGYYPFRPDTYLYFDM